MPDIKNYSTGRIGNKWPKHENTDHTNTKGLDKNSLPGIEAYIDEDIVRAYDDNRPIKNLLTNDKSISESINNTSMANNIDAIIRNSKSDWHISVEDYGYYVNPEDFSKQINITPLRIKVDSALNAKDGLVNGSSKKITGFERDDGTTLWVDEHDWNYESAPTLDDPDGAYTGLYRPIYSDMDNSAFPEDYKDYKITVRQRYTTGAVYTYDIYTDEEVITPLNTSLFDIKNEILNYREESNFPGYDKYPDTYVQLKSNNLGQLEISEDTNILKKIRREEHKLLANDFNAESGAYKANLRSDVFRNNKSNDVKRIENDTDFLNALGIDDYNQTSKVYFNEKKTQTGTLKPLIDNRDFLGNTTYSFEINIDGETEILKIDSPETRAYQEIDLSEPDPESVIKDTGGEITYDFEILLNNEIEDAVEPHKVYVTVDSPSMYELADAINESFNEDNIYAEAIVQKNGATYDIRIFSRSSGDYSKIEITQGSSDLAGNLNSSYTTPVDGISNWYIYYNPSDSSPEDPPADEYVAIRDSGSTTVNDFNTGHLNIGNQLFNEMVDRGYDNFEIGVSTYQTDIRNTQLYIKDIAAERGYIELNMNVPDSSLESGLDELKTYYFQLDVDGNGFEEYNFTTTTDTTYNGVINTINSTLSGVAEFSIEPTGEVRITSDSYGPQSYIDTENGTTGDSLFGAAYPAAGFTPVSDHGAVQYGKGKVITLTSRMKKTFTTFTDQIDKRLVSSKNDSILYVTPNTKADKRDNIDTLHAFKTINNHGDPYNKWSTHNDRVVQIDLSDHQDWINDSIINNIEEKNINGTRYLLVGNTSGQVFFLDDTNRIYRDFFIVDKFTLLENSEFSDINDEKINKFYVYLDGENNKEYLFISSDTNVLFADVTSGLNSSTSFIRINANSSLSVPNVSDSMFSEIRDIESWSPNVGNGITNRYLIFVGKSAENTTWEKAPLLYALYDSESSESPLEDRFSWYGEEIYRKTQIDDITSIVKFDGWKDPEQNNQVFIANNVNGPEIWAGNSQNNDEDLGTASDDKFNRFSWIEANQDQGHDPLIIDGDVDRITSLVVYDNRIFVGAIREDDDTLGGLYSYAINKLQKYFKIDVHSLFVDRDTDELYLSTTEGLIGNTIPSILRITEEENDGRAQIFSREELATVSNWPEDSAFRISLKGFFVGGVNFDGEYNIEFNGQGKSSLEEIADAINGSDDAGFKAAKDFESGIENDITPVIRARALTGYKPQGANYVPYYKLVIESKIPEDTDAGHSSVNETTQSNCSIEIKHPTIGTTIVGTGSDTIEVDPDTIGIANLRLVDWDDSDVYHVKRVGSDSISFSGNPYINISDYVDDGFEILSGSIRVKTNEDDELGFSQSRGVILVSNTLTELPDDDTKFGLKVIFNPDRESVTGTNQITELNTPEDSTSSLSGKYWNLFAPKYSSPVTEYYIWYNVDNKSIDPEPSSKTGVEVKIEEDSSASTVAQLTAEAINDLPDFDASSTSDKITITNVTFGEVDDPVNVDAGIHSINITQTGTEPDPDYDVNWIEVEGQNVQTVWELKEKINSQLTLGSCTMETIGSSSEYCDLLITSDLVGDDSGVSIEVDNVSGNTDLIGINALDLIPNKSISGNTSLNTSGSQTLGYTWENADFFYEKEHPDTGNKMIYIPNGTTRIDPGATVWINFWEWKRLEKIPAKDVNGDNNIPSEGEWTYDLEEKKIVVGEEPSKEFPQDVLYVDAKLEKTLEKLDFGTDIPDSQPTLSKDFHLTIPNNITNSEVILARPLSRVMALDYYTRILSTDSEDPVRSDYSFSLPRVDIIKVNRESSYYGYRTSIVKGTPDPDTPYIEIPLANQENDTYLYTTYINSSRYKNNNIVSVPWYQSDNLTPNTIYISGNTQLFKSENDLVSTRGLAPLRGKQKLSKIAEQDMHSIIRVEDPIGLNFFRRRHTDIYDLDNFYCLYVDPINGNDINNGKDRANAFSTLSAAIGAATSRRNNIIILKAQDGTIPLFDELDYHRSIQINIFAEEYIRVRGAKVNGSIYVEGIDFTSDTTIGTTSKVVLDTRHNFSAKYCKFNTIQTVNNGSFEKGIKANIHNSIFEETGFIVDDVSGNNLDIEDSVEVEFNHCYFKKAEIVYFYPNSYNTNVNNNFVFNSITNGLNETGYIIDTDKFENLQFTFNKSLLISGDTGNTNFASSAPITINETLSYTVTNNEAYGTGSILTNDSQAVSQGKIDIITETAEPISKFRGYDRDSLAINYVDNKYDVGAFIARRFEDKIKNNEIVESEKTNLLFNEKSAQYSYQIYSNYISFHVRFKPTGNFQQQGVLFDSRYDGDFNVDTSRFNTNANDFIQLVYDNKTYGLNYLASNKYSFKLIISNSFTTSVSVIGPKYDSDNRFEYNKWHEIAFLIASEKNYNPKYGSANLDEEIDSNRRQTVIYTMYDRYVDRIYALKNNPFEDESGTEISASNWKPGRVLATHFNIGKGWTAEWIDTPQGKAWSTWAETNYNMIVDQYLVSRDKLPINILKDVKSKNIVDRKENVYKTPKSDDKHTIILNHCNNSHPFSDNGVEPYEDYYVSYRPYEGYEAHSIAIEDISENFTPYGHIARGKWYDRSEASKWLSSDIEVLDSTVGDSENEIAIAGNDNGELKLFFLNVRTLAILDEIVIINNTATEAVLKLIGDKYVVIFIDSTDDKPYFRTITVDSHDLENKRTINSEVSDNIHFDRAHNDDNIIITYHEPSSNIGYMQIVKLSSGSIIKGKYEFSDSEDVTETNVIESTDENGDNTYYIFYREESTGYLKMVMYDSSLTVIVLSHDAIVQGQEIRNIQSARTRDGNTLVKWKDYISGSESKIHFMMLSSKGSGLIPETDVTTSVSDLDSTDDMLLLKDGNILFSYINRSDNSISYKLYSQTGEEVDTSSYLRDYNENGVDTLKLAYPNNSKDVSIVSKIDSEGYIINMEENLPTRWYKNSTGEYDSYLVEVYSTKTFFGQALRMAMNHTTSSGETGEFVADAESEDLSAFDASVETNGEIMVENEYAIHGTFGYGLRFDGSSSKLYAEKEITGLSSDSYGRFYLEIDKYFSLTTETTKRHEVGRFGNTSDPVILELEFSDPLSGGDGRYKVRAHNSLSDDTTPSTAIEYSKEHFIETRWVNDSSDGGFQVWIDDELLIDVMGLDTSSVGNADYISIGSQNTSNSVPATDSIISYDDVRVLNSKVGPYIAGLGQGIVWTKTNIAESGEKHYFSGYFYIVSGNAVIELDGPALENNIEITFNNDGTYTHNTYNEDSVTDIKTDMINLNGIYRFSIGFVPDNSDEINIKSKTANSDDDLRIDDFLIDNFKLEQNDYASSLTADSTGYIAYPMSLKDKGNIFIRLYPQFTYETQKHRTLIQGVNHNQDDLPYVTHELYFNKDSKKFVLFLQDATGNTATVESDEYGDASVSKKRTDLNEKHTISANWDVNEGVYELFIDDKYYKLEGQSLPNFKNSGVMSIGNDISRERTANSLFDLYRVSDEPLTHIEIEEAKRTIDPFYRNDLTNLGNVVVKSLNFYGVDESDKATIYSERSGNTSSLVLEVAKDYEDKVVIRQQGNDLAVFGSGAVTINGILKAKEFEVEAVTTMASYDDHITLRYGFSGIPPEYNDGYLEIQRGNSTNSEIRWDESQDSWIFHDGTNRYISIDGRHIGTWKDDNNFNLVSNGTGSITLSTNSSTDSDGDGTTNRTDGTQRVEISPVETVINNPGIDHDFRVEAKSGTNDRVRQSTHMIFADAKKKQVLIGRDSSDPEADTGALVVNYKSTIQSKDTVSFGTEEYRNDSGLRAGYIGAGNGSDLWEVVSEIQTLQMTAIDYDVVLSGTAKNSFDLQTAGGIKWDISGTMEESWRLDTEGGIQWNMNGAESTDVFRFYISSPHNESYFLNTAGGVRFRVRGTDANDKFKVETLNAAQESFHVDSAGGATFDVNNGFYVKENNNNAYFELNTSGVFNLNTENMDSNSIYFNTLGGIDIDAAKAFDLDASQGIFLNENSGSYLNINDNGYLDAYSVNGINIEENSGSSFTIDDTGVIDVTSNSSSYINMDLGGDIDIYSGDLANADINIVARNTGNILLTAAGDTIRSTSSLEYIRTSEFILEDYSTGYDLINAVTNKVELYHNNIWRLRTTSTGVDINGDLTVGSTTGSQSTFQSNSSYDGDGFFQTPWLYSSALEAPGERGTAGTAILVGAGTGFTNADEIALVTQGNIGLKVDSSTNVEIPNDLSVLGDVTVHGYFQFDNGTNVMTIQNIVDELIGPGADDTLVTEHAVIEYVEANYGQVLGTDGNHITLDALDGTELDRVIAPYAVNAGDANTVDGIHGSQFLRSDTADTVSGVLTFSTRPAFNGGTTGSTAPFTVDSNYKVANLNADLLDGIHGSQFLRSDSNDTMDAGTNTTLSIKSNDSGESIIQLYGDNQGTGRVYVGQNLSHGGGIEYNGNNSPVTTGAGSDYITLWRRASGNDYWTARNKYDSNDWEFRGNLIANGSTVHTESNHGSGSNTDISTSGTTIIDRFYTDNSGHLTSVGTRDLGTVVTKNYSTNINLGTSNAYVPTQKAVKTYVDNKVSGGGEIICNSKIATHSGDTNTYIQFHAVDQWRVVTGGGERLEVNNNNTTVSTDLTVGGHILPETSPTTGSHSIAKGTAHTPSRGLYSGSMGVNYRGGYFRFDTDARYAGLSGGFGGPFSGTNVTRIFSSGTSDASKTWYYAKY
jgi:hypothetical protein